MIQSICYPISFLSYTRYIHTFESNKSWKQGNKYFCFIINLFTFTIRSIRSLFATIRYYSLLFALFGHYSVTIRDYSHHSATVCPYSPLFATIRDYLGLFVTIRHYSRLFALFGHYSGFIIGECPFPMSTLSVT